MIDLRRVRWKCCCVFPFVSLIGCTTTTLHQPVQRPFADTTTSSSTSTSSKHRLSIDHETPATKLIQFADQPEQSSSIVLASSTELNQTEPAYPIDLPTVIRLVDSQSPVIAVAESKAAEAESRVQEADLQWLPNISVGSIYNRFDGTTQNQRGDVFRVSRSNLFVGPGVSLTLDLADVFYKPLIERRLANAQQLQTQSVRYAVQLEAISAYHDLLHAYALLEVNADVTSKAETMLQSAKNAKEAKLDRTAGDVNRAQTEVLLRQAERAEYESRVGIASARLAQLLQLQPTTRFVPVEKVLAPIQIIDKNSDVDQLITTAIASRPDIAANREVAIAAYERYQRSRYGVLLPKVAVSNLVGSYGGGLNDDLSRFDSRNVVALQVFWELKNFGFGNLVEQEQRSAQTDQVRLNGIQIESKAVSEIIESVHLLVAKEKSLQLALRANKDAEELYRISKEGTLNLIDAKNLFDALRPLQAIQIINQTRQNYVTAVVDYNRAQYRLLTQIGGELPKTDH